MGYIKNMLRVGSMLMLVSAAALAWQSTGGACQAFAGESVPGVVQNQWPGYEEAVAQMALKLFRTMAPIARMNGIHAVSFDIYDGDMIQNTQTRLAARLIADLGTELRRKGFQIKTGEASRSPYFGEYGTDCREMPQTITATHLVRVNLGQSLSGPQTLEMRTSVFSHQNGELLGRAKQVFLANAAIMQLYRTYSELEAPLGTRKHPYQSLSTAANQAVRVVAYRVHHLLTDQEAVPVVIAGVGLENASPVVESVTSAAAEHGFHVKASDEWLTMLLREGDRLEQNIYVQRYRNRLPATTLVLGVSRHLVNANVHSLEVRVYTLNPLDILYNGSLTRWPAGTMLPQCAYQAFFAQEEPEIRDSTIRTYGTNNKAMASGMAHGNKASALPGEDGSQVGVRKGRILTPHKMMGLLNQHLWGSLKTMEIQDNVIRMIRFGGMFSEPECWTESHYLAHQGVPARVYCNLEYDLILQIGDAPPIRASGIEFGQGSSRNAAINQALLGIEKSLNPLALDAAMTLSHRKSLKDLETTLQSLDQFTWDLNEDFDVDRIMQFIEAQIEDLS